MRVTRTDLWTSVNSPPGMRALLLVAHGGSRVTVPACGRADTPGARFCLRGRPGARLIEMLRKVDTRSVGGSMNTQLNRCLGVFSATARRRMGNCPLQYQRRPSTI